LDEVRRNQLRLAEKSPVLFIEKTLFQHLNKSLITLVVVNDAAVNVMRCNNKEL